MAYHLVDELVRVGGSRRLVKTFEEFEEAREWVVNNTSELYDFIPDITPERLPDFRYCRNMEELNKKLVEYKYHNWRLKLIQSTNRMSKRRLVTQNTKNKYWVRIKPYKTLVNSKYTNNGVAWDYIQTLKQEEKRVVQYADVSRVLATTKMAVLVEWLSVEGTVTTWIPRGMLVC